MPLLFDALDAAEAGLEVGAEAMLAAAPAAAGEGSKAGSAPSRRVAGK